MGGQYASCEAGMRQVLTELELLGAALRRVECELTRLGEGQRSLRRELLQEPRAAIPKRGSSHGQTTPTDTPLSSPTQATRRLSPRRTSPSPSPSCASSRPLRPFAASSEEVDVELHVDHKESNFGGGGPRGRGDHSSSMPVAGHTETLTNDTSVIGDNAQHEVSERTCRDLLLTLRNWEVEGDEALGSDPDFFENVRSGEFTSAIHYKNRYVHCKLLHFAVWFDCGEGDPEARHVRSVLRAGADLSSKARYWRAGKWVELEAIHIAAGMGYVPAMKALLAAACDEMENQDDARDDLLNRYCTIGGMQFYAPIHDAAFTGQPESLVWLLKCNADPNAENKDGYTPLHWLACAHMDSESELETMVKCLLKHGARLDLKTRGSVVQEKHRHRVPLQIAALPESQFPRHLMYMLSPALQTMQKNTKRFGDTGSIQSTNIFVDLALLARASQKAAQSLALAVKQQEECVRWQVICHAEDDNAVDLIALLIRLAPHAASVMLSLLAQKPIVMDPLHHPTCPRAILQHGVSNWFYQRTVPMTCTYQPDVTKKQLAGFEHSVDWPVWLYDPAANADSGQPPWPAWHNTLYREPNKHEEFQRIVQNLDTKVLLLPDALSFNMLKAIVTSVHDDLFLTLPVQGIIACFWQYSGRRVLSVSCFFNILELVALFLWGLSDTSGGSFALWGLASYTDSEAGFSKSVPLGTATLPFWIVLMAGELRDLSNISIGLRNHFVKWRFHRLDKEQDHSTKGLQELWHPGSLIINPMNWLELAHLTLKISLNLSIRHTAAQGISEMQDLQQSLLCFAFLSQCIKLLWMMRVRDGSGRQVLVIFKTLVSGTLRDMLWLLMALFLSFAFALVILNRPDDPARIMIGFYRGLTFADGTGMDELGLNPLMGHGSVYAQANMIVGLLGTIAFNILVLNLIIGMYSNEYANVEKRSRALFQRERAKYCCRMILSCRLFRVTGEAGKWLRILQASYFGALGCAVALVCFLVRADWEFFGATHLLLCVTVTCLFAYVQVMTEAFAVSSGWFPALCGTFTHSRGRRYLWMCHGEEEVFQIS